MRITKDDFFEVINRAHREGLTDEEIREHAKTIIHFAEDWVDEEKRDTCRELQSKVEELMPSSLSEGRELAEKMTEKIGIPGVRVEYYPGAHGGFSLWAGQAAWKLTRFPHELEAQAAKMLRAQKDTIDFYRTPDSSKGSTGQSWWEERD